MSYHNKGSSTSQQTTSTTGQQDTVQNTTVQNTTTTQTTTQQTEQQTTTTTQQTEQQTTTTTQQTEQQDTSTLTGTATMITGDNKIWQVTNSSNNAFLSLVQAGMIVNLSSEVYNYYGTDTIDSISSNVVMLQNGIEGATIGAEVNFEIDLSQIEETSEEEFDTFISSEEAEGDVSETSSVEEEESEEESEEETEDEPDTNPIVDVGLQATENDNFYFLSNRDEQYVGLYHKHQDGTLMIGEGVLGVTHELNPDEIIFKKFTYETLQEVREIVSDLFYKLWFEDYGLTSEQILSMQTTIRDGIKQTGRGQDEPLVFYKKDRNTLENRQDLQGDAFENICQNIYDNTIPYETLSENFGFLELPEIAYSSPYDSPLGPGEYWKLKQYVMRYTNGGTVIDITIAEEAIKYYDEDLLIGGEEESLGGG